MSFIVSFPFICLFYFFISVRRVCPFFYFRPFSGFTDNNFSWRGCGLSLRFCDLEIQVLFGTQCFFICFCFGGRITVA